MGSLPLRDRHGNVRAWAVIDPEDYGWASEINWHLAEGYASCWNPTDLQPPTARLLHRDVMDNPQGLQVDHINRNRLDNRRKNLRVVTHAQQAQNRSSNKRSSSRYRNVRWHKGAWEVSIGSASNGTYRYLGRFKIEEEAAEVATAARREAYPFDNGTIG